MNDQYLSLYSLMAFPITFLFYFENENFQKSFVERYLFPIILSIYRQFYIQFCLRKVLPCHSQKFTFFGAQAIYERK